MNVVPLLVLFSLCLAAGSVLLFVWSARLRDAEHSDRLSLLPLEDDVTSSSVDATFDQEQERE
ncbi:MAG: cytochrome oxidase [Planctomycetota bacterium]